ncbi:Ig-like domain-containing protein [Microscilla marina]|uniref:Ig-like domain-containing protein n=1 Tax=Microscilla marina TaxID=1027 RepID=UPI000948E53A|nr:T9SS type A sorting domain-containing protein [Microscilla marina]
MFKSDGTAAGTVLVKDINATSLGFFTMPSNPENLTNINGKLFFTADADFDGGGTAVNRELWVSDGTEAGTYMVKDIHPTGSSHPSNLIMKDGFCYFFANDGTSTSLWFSNGTPAGTQKVQFPAGTTVDPTAGLTLAGNQLFFAATDATRGTELWYSNGSVANPIDIYPGANSSNPQNFTQVGGDCYFTAVGEGKGVELWRSNGTSASLVKDIQPGFFGSNPSNLTSVKASLNGSTVNLLYFTAFTVTNGVELWKSDGTTSGTLLVNDLNPSAASNASRISRITAVPLATNQDRVFFSAYNGDANVGTELWHTIANATHPPNPPVPVPTPVRCGVGTLVLQVEGATVGQKYRWYASADATSFVKQSIDHNDQSFITPLLNASQSFYVSTVSTDGVWESDRVEVTAQVVTSLPSPIVNHRQICGTGQLGLTASSDAPIAVQYRWYDAPNGGVLLQQSTNAEYVVEVSGSTTYYVSVYSETCGFESTRTALMITYSPLTGGIIGGGQEVQIGGIPASITSEEEAGGGFGYIRYQWQSSENGIDWRLIAGEGNGDYQPGALTTTTYFRRLASSVECGQTVSNVVKVEVVPPLNTPTFEGQLAAVDTVWAVKLAWQNNDDRTEGFYLEKGDGVNFTPLATLTANENSYIDYGSILGNKAYYRLRAFKGSVTSEYVEIRIAPDPEPLPGGAGAEAGENTLVYPNPVGEIANIKLDMPESGHGEMILRSNEGRAVLRSSFNKTSEDEAFTLQLQSIKPGIYWLEIMIEGKRVVKRIIKN